jgi:hypothetical protein
MEDEKIGRILYPDTSSPGAYAGPVRGRRVTRDAPIMPDMWIAYGKDRGHARKPGVLLVPNVDSSVRELVLSLRATLGP